MNILQYQVSLNIHSKAGVFKYIFWKSHLKLDTGISVLCPLSFVLRHTQTTPLDSEKGWTRELWLNPVLLILEN